jgi:hypothetical protein
VTGPVRWLGRHPVLRDALFWALPALAFGLALRLLLLSYSPLAYFGSDSRSYFGFPHGVLTEFYFSLNEKRRFLYPIFLLPVSALPGGALRWLPWVQAAMGLAAVLPVAYVVRRLFRGWRWFIVPVTAACAGMPSSIWFEHEMLAECLFFQAIVWSVGGWVAVATQPDPARARRLWGWFILPFAAMLLTKPAGRFLLPGLAAGLVGVRAWRFLRLREAVAVLALLGLAGLMGDDEQGVWLLYTSVFPLTQTDSPRHAEYKAEIRDLVEESRRNLDIYSETDREIFLFLRNPKAQDARPRWRDLAKDEEDLAALYRDLALEAILAEPLRFAYLGFQKVVRSANPSEFKTERFGATYFAERFREQLEGKRTPESMVRLAFGLGREGPFPPIEAFEKRIAPRPDAAAARWLTAYADAVQRAAALVREPDAKRRGIWEYGPTPFGWWVLAAALIALAGPWRATLGVWTLAAGIYLFVVFLVGTQNVRYFAAAWPIMVLLLPLPAELALRVAGRLLGAARCRGSGVSPADHAQRGSGVSPAGE